LAAGEYGNDSTTTELFYNQPQRVKKLFPDTAHCNAIRRTRGACWIYFSVKNIELPRRGDAEVRAARENMKRISFMTYNG
jgi:hypothetical protein